MEAKKNNIAAIIVCILASEAFIFTFVNICMDFSLYTSVTVKERLLLLSSSSAPMVTSAFVLIIAILKIAGKEKLIPDLAIICGIASFIILIICSYYVMDSVKSILKTMGSDISKLVGMSLFKTISNLTISFTLYAFAPLLYGINLKIKKTGTLNNYSNPNGNNMYFNGTSGY